MITAFKADLDAGAALAATRRAPAPAPILLPSRAMIEIRLLAPDERPLLAPLVAELFRHYEMPAPDEPAIARFLAEQPPGVEILAAFAPEGPAGLASFAQLYPGLGAAPQIYMKELYVASAARGSGVGEQLVRALAQIAAARGCTRVDWTTSRENLGAQALYRRIGAHVVEEKVYFRLDAEGIARLSRGPAPRP